MKELESVVVRFSGDSGDGMQLTGTQFSNTSASLGHDLATFPDYPSEIRAPQGTVAGVSGFQVHFGATEIVTPGDEPDVLVAMNPAALKANIASLKSGGSIIVNADAFDATGLEKAGYTSDPFELPEVKKHKIIKVNITTNTVEALAQIDLDQKSKVRCKNLYALGMTYFMFGYPVDLSVKWINEKFAGKDALRDANITALRAGYNYAETTEQIISTYKVSPAKIAPGRYRQIDGNTATAWGFIQASEVSGRKLFLGSYPITPATDILQELSKHKNFEVRTFQAEDEIAGICTSIGASFTGALAITTTSGPGLALKGEAIGLAVMLELPLVIVNVQRGGPSTGLPTKTEQSDLWQALAGRNGEAPVVVLAASRPGDCFEMSFEASRIALEHMTPVILLTDGYIANGAEPWKIPDLSKQYNKIKTHIIDASTKPEKYLPYKRNDELVRPWAIPGMAGFEHRIGGLEKAHETGMVSYDADNHQLMSELRRDKVEKVADSIPDQEVDGDITGDLLVISWGGTYGAVHSAVREVQKDGKKVTHMHVRYINPMPKNLGALLRGFKRILVPELNLGQMKDLLNMRYQCGAIGYNKVKGLPFKVSELVTEINRNLERI